MSKELEALDSLYDISCNIQDTTEDYEIVEQALQRLEAIDNANPSEALERLENNKNAIPYAIDYRIIKQALIKLQEQEKILSILKEKRIGLDLFYSFLKKGLPYEVYFANYSTYGDGILSKEEFKSLRSWLG